MLATAVTESNKEEDCQQTVKAMKSEKSMEPWSLLTVLEPQPWGKIGTCFT